MEMSSSHRLITSFTGQHEFLSNFYPVPGGIKVGEYSFQSVEHAYQALKCPVHLRDSRWLTYLNCTPGAAKRLGKVLPLKENWDTIKDDVMKSLCIQKFDVPELASMLLETGENLLIEGNTWGDTYWGMCDGLGKNKLGRILMTIRFVKLVEKV